MYHYSVIQWLFTFYFYCFGGWCFESAYVSIKDKKLTNRGFMRGPFLPIYGSGATMMLVVSMPFQHNIVMTYIAGCVGATVLEYITGVLMEHIFKVRYWDYSGKKLNFQGHICLTSTLTWGFFTIVTTTFLQKQVEKVMYAIPTAVLKYGILILTVLIAIDFALSFKAAVDLRGVLEKMHQVKLEMSGIQKKLDGFLAKTGEGIGNKKEAITESFATLKGSIEGKLEQIKGMVQSKTDKYTDEEKEALLELNVAYKVNLDRHTRLSSLKDFIQRSMLRSNPGMISKQYHDSLEELKKKLKGE